MKRLYWRPTQVSWRVHVVITLLALAALGLVEALPITVRQAHYDTKLRAAQIMKQGLEVLKEARRKRLAIDAEVDPLETGLIGTLISPITSNHGALDAKLTTLNPNWAAVMVALLRRADVADGDVIALGLSGSFPALNLAALAAAEAMRLKVVAISSVAASAWGANLPDLTWLDMEAALVERRVISQRSVAASLGGQGDRALGMGKAGRDLLRAAVARNGLPLIEIADPKDNLDARLERYLEGAGGKPLAAYVNIGGGTVSVGTAIGKRLFRPGLNTRPPADDHQVDSLLLRFVNQGVPVIHITQIAELAQQHGLPVKPQRLPAPGQGAIFSRREYSRWLAGGGLVVVLLALYLFIKRDIGYRLFAGTGSKGGPLRPPEPMV